MNEEAARFELLKQELDHLDSGIRSFDAILFQVKGWCVTATVAIASVAVTTSRASVLAVALGAILGFWLLDGLHKFLQRRFIDRNTDIEMALHAGTVADVLNSNLLRIPNLTGAFARNNDFRSRLSAWMCELGRPLVYSLYLMLAALVLLLGIAMLLFPQNASS